MIKFNLPKELDEKEIQDFFDEKSADTKTILNTINNNVLVKTRIKRYQKCKYRFHLIPELNHIDDLHDALLSCYSSKTKRFKGYLNGVKDKAPGEYQNRCPYCGIGEVNTVDHILPKDRFPEYAFLPINLIYICSKCNSQKSDKYIHNKKRLFINPYIDNFLDEEFFQVNLEVDNIEPFIKYDVKINIDNISDIENKEIIKMHYDELELEKRIIKRIRAPINQNYKRIIKLLNKGNSTLEIKKIFLEQLEEEKLVFGVNHYKTSMSRAFGASDYIDNLYKYLSLHNLL